MSKHSTIYGTIFNHARTEMGFTQDEVAQLSGLSIATISNAEMGKGLHLNSFLALCHALDLDASAIVALMTKGGK